MKRRVTFAFLSLAVFSGNPLLGSEASSSRDCYKILQRMCAMIYDPVTCTYTGGQDLEKNTWKGSNLCGAHKQTDFFACINQEKIDTVDFKKSLSCVKDNTLDF